MNEVWPDKFGKGTFYTHLRPHLDRFLKGTEEEWHQDYHDASDILLGDAKKHSFLDQIYANPQYYAWWHLRRIEGNLNQNGSVPAEQNHSSITARLGKGACWSLVKHVERLISRQQEMSKIRREEDNKLYVFADRYKSNLHGPEATKDEEARRSLARFAFTHFYRKTHKCSIKLQSYCSNNGDHNVFPAGKTPLYNELVVI